tara:strand:- start:239 stop:625 length:387 start_codon:yes stop_codon:yes gene_type:complete
MKLNHSYKFFILFNIIFALVLIGIEIKADEIINKKVKNLTLELRCMTCQNQSIYDSDAEFSNDIKKIVRSQFIEGKSEKEIKEFLVLRYGEYILFKPLFNYKNLFLWGFPFTLLLIGLIFIVLMARKK